MTLEERWASLFELAFGRRHFRHGDDEQLYEIRRVHADGRVQLAEFPPSKRPDIVVEPHTLERVKPP